ncbi:hypothetical protein AVEN_230232-1 [Araneus ventricosus]|uniref:Uncharacterized protein n=1 Tax=Araneus ventricosus TaxID=182803 RepID=A0A4Y2DUT2_ARAVE|nr:hypothetical protein AVEN_230232-1 [Araneus ventricosus]
MEDDAVDGEQFKPIRRLDNVGRYIASESVFPESVIRQRETGPPDTPIGRLTRHIAGKIEGSNVGGPRPRGGEGAQGIGTGSRHKGHK